MLLACLSDLCYMPVWMACMLLVWLSGWPCLLPMACCGTSMGTVAVSTGMCFSASESQAVGAAVHGVAWLLAVHGQSVLGALSVSCVVMKLW